MNTNFCLFYLELLEINTLNMIFQYEIIFCIEDENDNQLRLYINSLKSKYPHVDTQVNSYLVFIQYGKEIIKNQKLFQTI